VSCETPRVCVNVTAVDTVTPAVSTPTGTLIWLASIPTLGGTLATLGLLLDKVMGETPTGLLCVYQWRNSFCV
jgi:hypothetical protein